MYYIRYKLYNVENAMLESKHADKLAVLAFYRSIADLIVFAQLWNELDGLVYVIQ